ncbi:MAG: DinB family protein [Mariniblastus sp.]
MSPIIEGLLFAWKKNLDYAPKLVADLSEEQMVAQPAPEGSAASNHPAWVLSHLNVYIPIVAAIVKGEAFEDPKGHKFGMQSKPESARDLYAPKDELVSEFIKGHDLVTELLGNADDTVFAKKVELPRWSEVMPTAGYALPYLMLNHENGHLGQLSAWRRIQAMPSV